MVLAGQGRVGSREGEGPAPCLSARLSLGGCPPGGALPQVDAGLPVAAVRGLGRLPQLCPGAPDRQGGAAELALLLRMRPQALPSLASGVPGARGGPCGQGPAPQHPHQLWLTRPL